MDRSLDADTAKYRKIKNESRAVVVQWLLNMNQFFFYVTGPSEILVKYPCA